MPTNLMHAYNTNTCLQISCMPPTLIHVHNPHILYPRLVHTSYLLPALMDAITTSIAHYYRHNNPRAVKIIFTTTFTCTNTRTLTAAFTTTLLSTNQRAGKENKYFNDYGKSKMSAFNNSLTSRHFYTLP